MLDQPDVHVDRPLVLAINRVEKVIESHIETVKLAA